MLGPGHVPGNSGQAATCAAFDPVNATLAVGCAGGQVALYALAELLDPGVGVPAPVRTLSQDEWGLDPNALGATACLRWSPDGRALAVGQARAGLSVWTASGCRVLCTLRQHAGVEPGILEVGLVSGWWGFGDLRRDRRRRGGLRAVDPRRCRTVGQEGGPGHTQCSTITSLSLAPHQGPVTALAWARHGARLLAAEGGSPQLLQELRFARTLAGDHRAILRRRWTGAQASGSELPPWLDPGEEGAGHALLVGGVGADDGPEAVTGRVYGAHRVFCRGGGPSGSTVSMPSASGLSALKLAMPPSSRAYPARPRIGSCWWGPARPSGAGHGARGHAPSLLWSTCRCRRPTWRPPTLWCVKVLLCGGGALA